MAGPIVVQSRRGSDRRSSSLQPQGPYQGVISAQDASQKRLNGRKWDPLHIKARRTIKKLSPPSTKGLALRYNYVLQKCLLVIRHARPSGHPNRRFSVRSCMPWRAREARRPIVGNKVSIVHMPHRRVETLRGPHRQAWSGDRW